MRTWMTLLALAACDGAGGDGGETDASDTDASSDTSGGSDTADTSEGGTDTSEGTDTDLDSDTDGESSLSTAAVITNGDFETFNSPGNTIASWVLTPGADTTIDWGPTQLTGNMVATVGWQVTGASPTDSVGTVGVTGAVVGERLAPRFDVRVESIGVGGCSVRLALKDGTTVIGEAFLNLSASASDFTEVTGQATSTVSNPGALTAEFTFSGSECEILIDDAALDAVP